MNISIYSMFFLTVCLTLLQEQGVYAGGGIGSPILDWHMFAVLASKPRMHTLLHQLQSAASSASSSEAAGLTGLTPGTAEIVKRSVIPQPRCADKVS
jgi:hypothetical protein